MTVFAGQLVGLFISFVNVSAEGSRCSQYTLSLLVIPQKEIKFTLGCNNRSGCAILLPAYDVRVTPRGMCNNMPTSTLLHIDNDLLTTRKKVLLVRVLHYATSLALEE